MGDDYLAIIAHYINRGHSLEEMLGLSSLERTFFLAAWEVEVETYFGKQEC